MAKTYFYEQLGVDRSANAAELKSAYRKLAKKYHPDVNPGDAAAEQKFKEVSEAYEVLKDDQSRAAYDQYGHAAFENGRGGNGGGGGFGGGFGDFGGMGDIFEEFFGGQRRQQRQQARRGGDLRIEIEITLEDAFNATEKQINLTRAGSCGTCKGSGARDGSAPTTCGVCNGHGKVRAQQGFFMVERACHNCQGRGQVVQNPCGDCNGRGTTQQQRNLTVSVPAGVEDGTRIRLSGEGNAGGPGATPGDLYVFVSVRPHAYLQRDGADLMCAIPIAFDLAARGGTLNVPLLNGKRVKLNIPSGAQSGQQFRLRGKGMPVLRSRSHGDLYVQIDVEVPSGLNKKQQALLDAFTDSLDDNNYPDVKDFDTRSNKANS